MGIKFGTLIKMRRIRIALIFLGISTIFKVVTNANVIGESIDNKADDRISKLEKRFEKFEEKNKFLEEKIKQLEDENKNLQRVNKDVNDDLEHLKDISEPTVFSAIGKSGHFVRGQYIEGFDEYLVNYGESFDASSGTFTADRNGVF